MLKIFSRFVDFLNTPFFESSDVYDFLDDCEGKMTPEEVLKIAQPFVLERGWIYENNQVKIGNEKPYLVREVETGKIFWFIYFSILTVNGEETSPQDDRTIGYVSVEDTTGLVLEIKGKKG